MSCISEERRALMLGEVNRLAFEEVSNANPSIDVLPDSPSSMEPQLPAHYISAIFPAKANRNGSYLFGQTIRYRGRDREIKECTVDDYGTSRIKGDWFFVTYADMEGMEVTASEMNDMLANRIE